MAGTSLLVLIDDIAAVLDDVALMTKVAAKKTAGVLGDDLALNAEKVSGVNADRELPVVWAVAKGSFLNKLILVPLALLISAYVPMLITPLLMLGGAYLCFEGAEKIVHAYLHKKASGDSHDITTTQHLDTPEAIRIFEQDKIKGAIRTDFILSAEIIVIALGTVQSASMLNQIVVVSLIALLMTVGVYTLVAGIVKLDDLGLYLVKPNPHTLREKIKTKIGLGILSFAPFLMKSLSVIGTVAMFLVGGSILLHGVPGVHAVEHTLMALTEGVVYLSVIMHVLWPILMQLVAGFMVGVLILLVVTGAQTLLSRSR